MWYLRITWQGSGYDQWHERQLKQSKAKNTRFELCLNTVSPCLINPLLSHSCLLSFLPLSHISPLSISNCNLSLQMCPTLLRMSSAHQLARTVAQSHGTLLHLTAAFPLKVALKHIAANVHIWCLPPRRKQQFRIHSVYHIAMFLNCFLKEHWLFNDFTVRWYRLLQGTWWRGRRLAHPDGPSSTLMFMSPPLMRLRRWLKVYFTRWECFQSTASASLSPVQTQNPSCPLVRCHLSLVEWLINRGFSHNAHFEAA